MNTTLLDEKIQLLKKEQTLDKSLVEKVYRWLLGAEDWELYRINPVVLTQNWGCAENQLIDIFVYGARLGLFDFSWSIFCPYCGEIQDNLTSFHHVHEDFFCTVCQAPVDVNMDDMVEVTFTINPSIKTLQIDPYKDIESYQRTFFSRAVQRSQEFIKYLNDNWLGFETCPPHETLIIDRTWMRGGTYRFVTAGFHSQFLFEVAQDAGEESEHHELIYTESGLNPQKTLVQSINALFHIVNKLSKPLGIMMVQSDIPTLHQMMMAHPSKLGPFLSGNRLLNNPSFQQFFKLNNLPTSLRLNIRSLTLLFTDLKGSTELYDRTGDVNAYRLIQDHFQLLGKIIVQHSGTVIKTMGDAVMASFSRPLDAVAASLDMLEEIKTIREEDKPLGLKIGLHEGPALAISNQGVLDYFGQTVNIAARVQGLAEANSLWMTEAVYQSQGVEGLLRTMNYQAQRYLASLKGVGAQTTVFEVKR